MKKVITIMGLFGLIIVQAQVGINNDNPEATLDIKSEGNLSGTKALKITNKDNVEMVTVTDDGKVGIGTTTPQHGLHLTANQNSEKDNIVITSYESNSIGVPHFIGENFAGTSTAPKATPAGKILVGLSGRGYPKEVLPPTTTDILGGDGGIYIESDGTFTSTNRPTKLRFYTKGLNGAENTNAMIINRFGDVAIGSDGPKAKLHVFGRKKISGGQGYSIAIFDSSENLAYDDIRIGVPLTSITGEDGTVFIEPNSMPGTGIGKFTTWFRSPKSTNGVSEVRHNVVFDGNVGIGTTTPTEKLEVTGSVKIADGTQGAGKVLTSDATGKASWQTPAKVVSTISTQLGTGVTITNANKDQWLDTGTTITLPPGKWVVTANLVFSATMTNGATNEGRVWIRATWCDSPTATAKSADIISTSYLISGGLAWNMPFGSMIGSVIINNTTTSDKIYHLKTSNGPGASVILPPNMEIHNFGGTANVENTIIGQRLD